jgi:UDP-N-acetylglucosamine--N-acetylmuramyl-(pentapeptide) pyrophosphoryl-undecaprenol N-acetylglucosamine transferase
MAQIIPDVIFTNGGYVAFPVLVVARVMRIPVVIHVSDTVPSRVLLYGGKFAKKISLAFPEAEDFFKHKERIALTGNPIRSEIQKKQLEGAYEYYKLDPKLPTI